MYYEKLQLKKEFPFLGENGRDPVLELYLPENLTEMKRDDQKRPCMVVCPGGGYWICSRREAEPIALHFLPVGFNVFVLTYSTAPHHTFPAQIREVAAVMELIYQNAEKWHCDTEKVAILGFSAGGHLAAHYSTAFDCKAVREVFPQSKPVNASVLCYPVITTDLPYSNTGSFGNLIGKKELTKEEDAFFSCEKAVNENTPPAFLWHTASDTTVPVMNSILYAEALSRFEVPFELHIYPYGGHGLATCDEQTVDDLTDEISYAGTWLPAVKKWLRLMGF